MPGGVAEITVKQIEPGDKLSGLSLGHADFVPLKTFLTKHAHKYEMQSLARTYGAFTDQKIVGYITLTCGEVISNSDCDQLIADVEYPYHHYPAVKIARLAVDRRLQGKGLGQQLVKLAVGQAKSIICPAVGCRFITVDSKKQSVDFYRRSGFTLLDTKENRERSSPVMWIDLNRVTTV